MERLRNEWQLQRGDGYRPQINVTDKSLQRPPSLWDNLYVLNLSAYRLTIFDYLYGFIYCQATKKKKGSEVSFTFLCQDYFIYLCRIASHDSESGPRLSTVISVSSDPRSTEEKVIILSKHKVCIVTLCLPPVPATDK